MKQHKKTIYLPIFISTFIGIVLGVIGLFLGQKIKQTLSTSQVLTQSIRPQTSTSFPFLSSRIETYADTDRIVNFVPLRYDLRAYMATQSSTYSLYFEYIPTGNNIGINESDPFAYASLLKVPLVMTIYKQIEQGKTKKTDALTVTDKTLDTKFGSLWKRGIGTKITVEEAIHLTLTQSDNTAYQLLRTLVTAEEFAAIFENLDIPLAIENGEPVVTAKNFTSILRGLYFSSIVTEESSQEILTYLSQSTFTQGIRAPIPSTITIAHKMGIREETDSLSDCGLVYLPQRPYFICIVSQNNTTSTSEQVMQTISKKVYDYLKQ